MYLQPLLHFLMNLALFLKLPLVKLSIHDASFKYPLGSDFIHFMFPLDPVNFSKSSIDIGIIMNPDNCENILGYPVTTLDQDRCVHQIYSWIMSGRKRKYVVCVNPHSLKVAKKDLPDLDIRCIRLSTGELGARMLAERANPQADLVWGWAVTNMADGSSRKKKWTDWDRGLDEMDRRSKRRNRKRQRN